MPPALASPTAQLALALVLGAAGVYLLLPKPRRRSVALGTFLLIAAAAAFALFLVTDFGRPIKHAVGEVLFWLFSATAVLFAAVMITQRNPARGAIAFAFVILSVCGLFLLLAAPFIMATTVIIYAGAIIVTFLFVLMLSHVSGPSDENDRSREPLMGSLAGFAFVGLILFTIHQADGRGKQGTLPEPPVLANDREQLTVALAAIDDALAAGTYDDFRERIKPAHDAVALVSDSGARRVGSPRNPRQVELTQATWKLSKANDDAENKTIHGTDFAQAKEAAKAIRGEVAVYAGHGLLPARNVANLGYVLYSEHILAVEMAGTLLLVATIGAVAIVGRRREVAA